MPILKEDVDIVLGLLGAKGGEWRDRHAVFVVMQTRQMDEKMGTVLSIRTSYIPSNLLSIHPLRTLSKFIHSLYTSNTSLIPAKMVLLSVAIGGMLGLALASPFPEPNPEAQISLPPLIPSVPGFTDPISQTAPPGVVLQPPTPPLPSPPFTGSDLKPKKIGYFWTGAGDNKHAGMSSI